MFSKRKTASDLLGMARVLISKDSDGKKVARHLLFMAKEFIGIDFPNQDAMDKYLKEHPDADRTNHRVVKMEKGPAKEDESKGERPKKLQKDEGDETGQKEEGDKSKVIQPKKKEDKSGKPEKKRVQYKAYIKLDKPKLNETLTKGHYTLISAGRNGDDPKEAGMSPDDEFFHKRHEELRAELEKSNLPYTEVVGHYGSKENTFLVFHDETEATQKTQKSIMVHHADAEEGKKRRKILEDLGKKFNQNSVLHAGEGRNEVVFTTGSKAGKTCGGNGWKEVPDAEDFYTDIELKGTQHTKFQLDIHECFERGLL